MMNISLQPLDGPTWSVRRPRAPREPGRGRPIHVSAQRDMGDADGIDALLRLADVAQNASMLPYSGESGIASNFCGILML